MTIASLSSSVYRRHVPQIVCYSVHPEGLEAIDRNAKLYSASTIYEEGGVVFASASSKSQKEA